MHIVHTHSLNHYETPVLADSVTVVPADCAGRVLVTGSHGGRYSAVCALKLQVGAAVFNDAGRGLEDAGVAGLELLDQFNVPAVAVSHITARIGDAADQLERGRVSVANRCALESGVAAGDLLRDAWTRLCSCEKAAHRNLPDSGESAWLVRESAVNRAFALDSASLVDDLHINAVVITGSHGGLLGGRASSAIKRQVLVAFYNDAGVGIDGAGISRLPALDERGIAGIAVNAFTARIGDGMSTYRDGVASHVNQVAFAMGLRSGMRVTEIVEMLCPVT